MAAMALTREKILEDIDALTGPPAECPECRRLRDALVAADRLLAEIGVRRAEPQTWEEMVMAVERRGA